MEWKKRRVARWDVTAEPSRSDPPGSLISQAPLTGDLGALFAGDLGAPFCARERKKSTDILVSRLKPRPTKRRLPGPQRPTRRDTSKSAQAESLCHRKTPTKNNAMGKTNGPRLCDVTALRGAVCGKAKRPATAGRRRVRV